MMFSEALCQINCRDQVRYAEVNDQGPDQS
jgi:hypothetical protein